MNSLELAVVGKKHFGNPIPPEWYAAAKELLENKEEGRLLHPWTKWTGDYEKQAYDVWIKGVDIVLGCWPNAGRMVATDGSDREWTPEQVLAVRVSSYQGDFPKPF